MKIIYPKINKEQYLKNIEAYQKKLNELADMGKKKSQGVYDENYQRIMKKAERIWLLISIITVLSGIAFIIFIWQILIANESGYPELGAAMTFFAVFFLGMLTLRIYSPKEKERKKYNNLYDETKKKYAALYEDKKREYEAACPGATDEKTEQQIVTFLEKIEMFKISNVKEVNFRIYNEEKKNVFELSTNYGDPLGFCVMFNFPYLNEALKPGKIDFSVLDEKIKLLDFQT